MKHITWMLFLLELIFPINSKLKIVLFTGVDGDHSHGLLWFQQPNSRNHSFALTIFLRSSFLGDFLLPSSLDNLNNVVRCKNLIAFYYHVYKNTSCCCLCFFFHCLFKRQTYSQIWVKNWNNPEDIVEVEVMVLEIQQQSCWNLEYGFFPFW